MYGPKWPFLLILIVYGPGVVVVNCWDRFCTLGELPVQRRLYPIFMSGVGLPQHPRIFRELTGCQRTPGKWGVIVGYPITFEYLKLYSIITL